MKALVLERWERRALRQHNAPHGEASPLGSDRELGQSRTDVLPLDRYLQGWAEADPLKLIAATAPHYRFHDPLVGTFTQDSINEYFDCLRARFSRAGMMRAEDVAFFLHGPLELPSSLDSLCFWREAPRLGLAGTSQIDIGPHGVIADSVAYDLNLASDSLRRQRRIRP